MAVIVIRPPGLAEIFRKDAFLGLPFEIPGAGAAIEDPGLDNAIEASRAPIANTFSTLRPRSPNSGCIEWRLIEPLVPALTPRPGRAEAPRML